MIYLWPMRRMPALVAVVLSLILVVTAQGMATARGQPPAMGQMVLCTGQGMVTVFTDAEGRPTGPPQLCADGAQALFGLDLGAPVVALHRSGVSEVLPGFVPVPAVFAGFLRVSARDPPRV